VLWIRLHESSHIEFVQARALGPFRARAQATGVPQQNPASREQPPASPGVGGVAHA